jgi:hypothetical protein
MIQWVLANMTCRLALPNFWVRIHDSSLFVTGRDENPGSRALDTRERVSHCKTRTSHESATIRHFVIQSINKAPSECTALFAIL